MAQVPLIGKREFVDDNTKVTRLLVCYVCKSVEPLLNYVGDPEGDIILSIALEKHAFPSGEPHKGRLFIFPTKYWEEGKYHDEIMKQISGQGKVGLDAMTEEGNFYATKDNFKEDAMTCYAKHLRPEDNCDDYQNSSKRLLPQTAKERREVGLPSPAESATKIYLCNFCPIHSVVQQRKRKLLGMYEK